MQYARHLMCNFLSLLLEISVQFFEIWRCYFEKQLYKGKQKSQAWPTIYEKKKETICPCGTKFKLSIGKITRKEDLWIPTHGRAKAGRPARTYIQQLCEDTGCCPEDLPRAMNDREEWRERVRDIRAPSTIWWWWWTLEWTMYKNKHNLGTNNWKGQIKLF